MTPDPRTASRNPHVDFLRGIAILLVMLGHFSYSGAFSEPVLISLKLLSALAPNNYLGVSVFFVISGYIITQTSLRRYGSFGRIGIPHFFVYRASRILPPLVLVVLLNLALYYGGCPGFEIPPATGVSVPKLLLYTFTFRFNLLYLNGGALLAAWAPLWSLAIEEVFYCCFPLASRILRLKVLMGLLFGCVLVQGYFYRTSQGWGSLYLYRGCFDSLALGCLVATFAPNFAQLAPPAWVLRLLRGLGLVVLFYFYLAFDLHKSSAHVWLPLAVSAGAALFLLGSSAPASAAREPGPSGLYRAVGFAGFLSYELYIFHLPVLILLRPPVAALNRLTHGLMPADFNFVVFAAAMCLLCAGLSRYYCEPLLRFIRSKAPAKAP